MKVFISEASRRMAHELDDRFARHEFKAEAETVQASDFTLMIRTPEGATSVEQLKEYIHYCGVAQFQINHALRDARREMANSGLPKRVIKAETAHMVEAVKLLKEYRIDAQKRLNELFRGQ